MNCYNHPDRSAVGVCLACGRGLCQDCAAEVVSFLACREHCEIEVEKIHRYRHRWFSEMAQMPARFRARRWRYILFGLAALCIGLHNAVSAHRCGDVEQVWLYIGLAFVGTICFSSGAAARSESWERTCRSCGYNLTGNRTGRCPECGAEIKT